MRYVIFPRRSATAGAGQGVHLDPRPARRTYQGAATTTDVLLLNAFLNEYVSGAAFGGALTTPRYSTAGEFLRAEGLRGGFEQIQELVREVTNGEGRVEAELLPSREFSHQELIARASLGDAEWEQIERRHEELLERYAREIPRDVRQRLSLSIG